MSARLADHVRAKVGLSGPIALGRPEWSHRRPLVFIAVGAAVYTVGLLMI